MRLKPSTNIAIVPLLVCFFLAFSLWLYASMREEYTTVVDIPLDIRLPIGRTLETETNSFIRAQVQGAGWQLVNHFLSSSIRCVVYIPEKRLAKNDEELSNLAISRQMLNQAIQAPVGITVQRVMNDSLPLVIGSIAEKRVAVRPVLDLEMREGFIVAQMPSVSPDSVVIRGSRTMLRRIAAWNTTAVRLRDVYEPTRLQTTLDDTLAGLVNVPQVPITVNLSIQQMAEGEFHDIPVKIAGAPSRHPFVIQPERVTVALRGGVENIARVLPEHIAATLEYADVLAGTTGTLRPRITLAIGELQVISVTPQFLRCSKRFVAPPKAW